MSEREPLSEDQSPFSSADDSDSALPVTLFTVMAIMAAFSTYFCMYAFRKPFSAASYEGLQFLNTSFDLKTVLVTSQIIGYLDYVDGLGFKSSLRLIPYSSDKFNFLPHSWGFLFIKETPTLLGDYL